MKLWSKQQMLKTVEPVLSSHPQGMAKRLILEVTVQ